MRAILRGVIFLLWQTFPPPTCDCTKLFVHHPAKTLPSLLAELRISISDHVWCWPGSSQLLVYGSIQTPWKKKTKLNRNEHFHIKFSDLELLYVQHHLGKHYLL